MSAYIIYRPLKKGDEGVYHVTDNLEEAKQLATQLRDSYFKKGWDSWAKRVKIIQPASVEFAREMANDFVRKGNSIDMMNQGNTFRGDGKAVACMNMDTLYSWANVLRKAYPA